VDQKEAQIRKLRRRIEEYLRQKCTTDELLKIAKFCKIDKIPKNLKK